MRGGKTGVSGHESVLRLYKGERAGSKDGIWKWGETKGYDFHPFRCAPPEKENLRDDSLSWRGETQGP